MDENLAKTIQGLIDDMHFEDALDLLKNETDEMADLNRVICYMGLKDYPTVITVAEKILQNEQNKYYYDVMSLYLVALVESHKEQEAIAVLKSELEMPFIPHEFEGFFKGMYEKLTKQTNDKEERSPFDLYTDDKINEILLTTDDFETLALAIYQTHKRNIRNFLASLEVVLMNVEVPNYIKTIILELMHEQNVTEEFEYHTKEGNFRVEPHKLTPLFETDTYNDIIKLLQDKIGADDVSLADVCYEVAATTLAGMYPNLVNKEQYNAFAGAVYKFGNALLGNEIPDSEIMYVFDIDKPELDESYIKVRKLSQLDS